jgi:hypothetical protein
MESLREGDVAYWISNGTAEFEERTLDIDSVLNRRFAIKRRSLRADDRRGPRSTR